MDNICEANETPIDESSANRTRGDESSEQRDGEGRYRKGNKGGPGNPFARQVALLRKAALEAVSEEDIRGIMHALKEKALAGDIAAAKLVLAYGAGKPTPSPDPDTLDQHEFRTHLNNNLCSAEGIVGIIQGLPLDLVLKLVRAVLPALEESKRKMAAEVIRRPAAADDGLPGENEGERPGEGENDFACQGTLNQGEEEGLSGSEMANPGEGVLPDYLREILERDAAQQQAAALCGPAGLAELQVLAAQVSELRELLEQAAERKKAAEVSAEESSVPHAARTGGRLAALLGGLDERGPRLTNGSIPHRNGE
jgi:hypothetical protein